MGRKLVAELAQSHLFQRLVPYDGPGKEKLEQHVVDFDKIDENKDLFCRYRCWIQYPGHHTCRCMKC